MDNPEQEITVQKRKRVMAETNPTILPITKTNAQPPLNAIAHAQANTEILATEDDCECDYPQYHDADTIFDEEAYHPYAKQAYRQDTSHKKRRLLPDHDEKSDSDARQQYIRRNTKPRTARDLSLEATIPTPYRRNDDFPPIRLPSGRMVRFYSQQGNMTSTHIPKQALPKPAVQTQHTADGNPLKSNNAAVIHPRYGYFPGPTRRWRDTAEVDAMISAGAVRVGLRPGSIVGSVRDGEDEEGDGKEAWRVVGGG